MRILYCVPQLYRPGGIERIVTLKANYLVEKFNYDVCIVVAEQNDQSLFYDLNPKINVIDLDLPYDNTLKLPLRKRLFIRNLLHKRHKRLLSKILFDYKPDIAISTFTHESTILPQIKDGSKKILEFHFCRGYKRILADVGHYSFIKKMLYNISCWQDENLIIPKYDQFVVLTEEDRELWLSKISNVITIPNMLTYKDSERAMLKSKNAIAVGRFDEQKGFDMLIRIWSAIVKHCPEWNLDIYGQGPEEQLLKEQINILQLNNSVRLHKPSSNIQKCYKESSLLLMTSRYEGWGLVLTEAMQCGLPVVAYACKCGPSDIIRDSEDGYIVPYGDESKFISSAVNIMSNDELRIQFGNNAYTNVQRYSQKEVMNRWNLLFQELIKRKR